MTNKHAFLAAAVAVVLLIAALLLNRPTAPTSPPEKVTPPASASEADQRAAKIIAERKATDESVWAKEVQAQAYEEVFIDLWNQLLNSADMLDTISAFQFGKLLAGQPGPAKELPYGIKVSPLNSTASEMNGAQFKALAASLKQKGIRLDMTEWHHGAFDTFPDGTAESKVSTTLYLEQAQDQRRWVVKGTLKIKWPVREPGKPFAPAFIDTTDLTLAERQGPKAYSEIPAENLGHQGVIPAGGTLLVYDLDRDGLDDILLPARNQIYWNQGGFKFKRDVLLADPGPIPLRPLGAAVVADVTGDGNADLLLSTKHCAVALYEADKSGRFTTQGKKLFTHSQATDPSVLTAGDVNGDGRLDLWLTQYRQAYQGGQMPTPYFDANDGYPSYLLINQGGGNFIDATEASGLAPKRFRRTYSTSFVDLDEDQDLDLIVVSDYSGVDVYRNNGKGQFEDITSQAVDERANFGMSHAFGDFNRDGKLDFFVTGMSSTTARRLEHMKLGREEFPDYQKMRMPMGYGNRMYLRQADGNYRQPAWRDQVARSGWSWGCAAFDFANDGLLDIYIANGHISGKTTKDYCTRFWTQDIYTGSPVPDLGFAKAMQAELNNTRDWSWNGYEKKALFLGTATDSYYNSSYLLGIAFEYDGRHVISADLDNDGRRDFLIVEQQNSAKPNETQQLHVLKNTFTTDNNWIGFRFTEEPGFSPIGARVVIKTASYESASCLINGDSFDSQHPLVIHYGLGKADKVAEATVYWPNGKTSKLLAPAANRYHPLSSPK